MVRPSIIAALAVAALALPGCGSSKKSTSATTSSTAAATQTTPAQQTTAANTIGPEGIVLEQGTPLAPASAAAQGSSVNGIQCGGTEQFVLHVHAHLAVYVNGQPRQVPPGVGLVQPAQVPGTPSFYTATQCFYWLHTHAADGIIHIESPSSTRIFTLGDFFAEWRQPLSSDQAGPAKGSVTAFLNGKRWGQNPATIPLNAHYAIQLDVGSPVVAPQPVSFGNSGL
jgi:hypothetical protein